MTEPFGKHPYHSNVVANYQQMFKARYYRNCALPDARIWELYEENCLCEFDDGRDYDEHVVDDMLREEFPDNVWKDLNEAGYTMQQLGEMNREAKLDAWLTWHGIINWTRLIVAAVDETK